MPDRRKGAAGSFGAPLETIVAGFPAGGRDRSPPHGVQTAHPGPSLTRDQVGASIRAAFALIDAQEGAGP